MIKIILVDDHPIVRTGLKKLLEKIPDIKVTAEAGSTEELMQYIEKKPCDMAVLDINLPGKSGLEIIPSLLNRIPLLKIIMLSMSAEGYIAAKALKLGAKGYLTKSSVHEELQQAVNAVRGGGTYISRDIPSEELTEAPQKDSPLLSPREEQILRLIAEGKTMQQIAEELFLSTNTIRTYRTRIMEKLNISSSNNLIRYAVRIKN